MPVINELEGFEYVFFKGPGVDALDRRKEDNNNQPITGAKLQENLKRVRSGLSAGLKSIVAAGDRRIS